jgi:hypothetical protein
LRENPEEMNMPEYFNADKLLPPDLVTAVLRHIPKGCESGALVFFKRNYYTERNAEIIALFRIYQDDPRFGSITEIQEALSEQFGVSERHINRILQGEAGRGLARGRRIRRLSGMFVARPRTKRASPGS